MVKENLIKTNLHISYKNSKSFSTSCIKNNCTDADLLKFANAIISLQISPAKHIHKTSFYKLEK